MFYFLVLISCDSNEFGLLKLKRVKVVFGFEGRKLVGLDHMQPRQILVH